MRLRRRAIVPLTLGLGMLGVVVAAGLTPNTGVVRAASNCTYGQCVAAQPFPLWAVAASVAVVVVALLLALLLLRRRRRPGQPPSEWEGPSGPSSGAPPGALGPEETAPVMAAGAVAGETTPAWQESPASEAPVEPEPEPVPPAREYLTVPTPPPPVPVAMPATPVTAEPVGAEAAGEESEPDIDSLMAELEKISGEILKKSPKKGQAAPAESADDADS
jgi:hypothetical protein